MTPENNCVTREFHIPTQSRCAVQRDIAGVFFSSFVSVYGKRNRKRLQKL